MASFATTTLFLLTTMNYNGQLAAVPVDELPPPYKVAFAFNEEACNLMRGKLLHPERYVCQRWEGQKGEGASILWKSEASQPTLAPAPPQPQLDKMKATPEPPKVREIPSSYHSGQECPVGISAIECNGHRLAERTSEEPPPQPQKARRVVHRQQQQQQSPLEPLIAFFTGGTSW
jgi:hypothetical protein